MAVRQLKLFALPKRIQLSMSRPPFDAAVSSQVIHQFSDPRKAISPLQIQVQGALD